MPPTRPKAQFRRRLALVLSLACLATGPLAAQQGERDPRVDAIFATLVAPDAPGCAVGVRQGGAVVHRAGYGLADLEHRVPITPSSVFYTGSLSKQFTAASVVLAARDGKLDLDVPARRWLPELPDAAARVNLRQMLHHTSGLREKWDLLAMQGVPVATTLITQQMVLDLVRRQRGVNAGPGVRYAYNNTGYDLLATALQRATGESIREYAQRRIFGPLAMTSTRYADRYGELIADRANGYAREGEQWTAAPAMVETVGSGSVYSSVDDLLKWTASFEHGLLGDSALQQMLETPGKAAAGSALPYAFGLQVDHWMGKRRVWHTGALAGYRAVLWRLPAEQWSAVILCNSAEAKPGDWVEQVAKAYFPPPKIVTMDVVEYPSQTINVRVPEPPPIPADIVGRYWSDESQVTWTIAARDGGYWLSRGTVPDVVLVSTPNGAVRALGWQLHLERAAGAEAGGVTALVVGAAPGNGIRFERVE